jgi:uncharacterized damage-inducible protein DinB
MTEKEQFLATYEREYPVTLKVLRAYPAGRADLRPHERSRNAQDLAWTFVFEGAAGRDAVAGQLAIPPKSLPARPDSWDGVVNEVERSFRGLAETVRNASDGDLKKTVKFPVGPNQMGDWRLFDFLWFLLNDMIHHRGQLTVYLRMAGGKVPAIYGPSADEPWM